MPLGVQFPSTGWICFYFSINVSHIFFQFPFSFLLLSATWQQPQMQTWIWRPIFTFLRNELYIQRQTRHLKAVLVCAKFRGSPLACTVHLSLSLPPFPPQSLLLSVCVSVSLTLSLFLHFMKTQIYHFIFYWHMEEREISSLSPRLINTLLVGTLQGTFIVFNLAWPKVQSKNLRFFLKEMIKIKLLRLKENGPLLPDITNS